MDAKLKAKWIRALLSGKYRQGEGALRDGRAYCCLGVLADIQKCRWSSDEEPFLGKESMGARLSPGGELRPKFAGGLSHKTQASLIDMNDTGAKFSEIAEYIKTRISAR
jgi:hypothetical protein